MSLISGIVKFLTVRKFGVWDLSLDGKRECTTSQFFFGLFLCLVIFLWWLSPVMEFGGFARTRFWNAGIISEPVLAFCYRH